MKHILSGLRQAPKVLAEFVNATPEDKLGLRRGEGFWTIAEHVSHLAQVQPMLLERLDRFMNEVHPEFVPFIPGDDEGKPELSPRRPIDVALTQFSTVREKQLALLNDADERTWQREAIHPEYDRYSLVILVRHILMHDYWHMYRMEELWLTRDAYLTRLE